MIINTSRGALVYISAVIEGLKSEQIGSLGLDVYEQEADLFYENLSERIIHDDVLKRLVTFPNVIVTSHQAYFTETARENISNTTIANLTAFEHGESLVNEVTPRHAATGDSTSNWPIKRLIGIAIRASASVFATLPTLRESDFCQSPEKAARSA